MTDNGIEFLILQMGNLIMHLSICTDKGSVIFLPPKKHIPLKKAIKICICLANN